MRKWIVVVLIVWACFSTAMLVAGIAYGQNGMIAPNAFNIYQAIPVMVTIPGANGQAQNVPLTVTVALQVKVDGRQVSAVTLLATPAATSPGAIQRDSRGIAYRLDVKPPFSIASIDSSVNSMDGITIVGEVQNTGSNTYKYVEIIATFYKDGKVIGTDSGYATLDELGPGQTSPFQVMTMSKGTDANGFTIQVQGRMK